MVTFFKNQMFSILLIFPLFVSLCLARPQEPAGSPAPTPLASPPKSGEGAPAIPIINQTDESNPDGSFQFSFETGNGIKVEEKGYLKDGANASEKIQVIEGSVSYTDNDGNPVNLKYIADENGYQPQGDHIPKAPDSQLGSLPNSSAPGVAQPYSGQPASQLGSQPGLAQPAAETSATPEVQPATAQ